MSNYLMELAAIHLVLVGAYWLLLRQEVQYGQMRGYLVGATILALVVPLFKLPRLFAATPEPIVLGSGSSALPSDLATTPLAPSSLWPFELLLVAYLLVSAFFLFKFARNLRFMLRLEKNSHLEKWGKLYIRRVQQIKGSFTFFNWIFLSAGISRNQEEYDAILRHEKAHVTFGHTYDLMLFELFKVFFWWLPTSWIIRKEIKKIHEYQADEYALRSYTVNQYSSILISSTLRSNGLSLASSFHDGLILQRLSEMKRKTKNVSPWKPGAIVALVTGLFIAFACTEERVGQVEGTGGEERELFTVVEQLPDFEGGMSAFYSTVMSEIRYPKEARVKGVEGKLFAQFVVERDGSLSNIEVVKGLGAGIDEEAKRVLGAVSSFKPASQRGRTVRVRMVMPLTFKLQEENNADGTPQGAIIIDELTVRNSQLNIQWDYSSGAWSGTVYDEQNNELPGANIVIAGTTAGTVSDLDGTFRIEAEESEQLIVSFVGYESVKSPTVNL
ncbi:MAG: TonB family protein [Bacteroidota bacterium]